MHKRRRGANIPLRWYSFALYTIDSVMQRVCVPARGGRVHIYSFFFDACKLTPNIFSAGGFRCIYTRFNDSGFPLLGFAAFLHIYIHRATLAQIIFPIYIYNTRAPFRNQAPVDKCTYFLCIPLTSHSLCSRFDFII